MEVVGRHALFFDDDANANFVNSKEALVEWNSLFIDRYDVRHLLSSPPASFKRLHQTSGSSLLPDPHLESELDVERYADLPSQALSDQETPELDADMGTLNAGGYHAVTFSYGSNSDAVEHKNDDTNLEADGFNPPFPVPENLVHSLPSSEKLHQIISRTALFVSQHGGQSEIVLRVKQGDNPTFGFLMPHHHLHPYFRYLVDHPEILNASYNGNSHQENNTENKSGNIGGALSLLGSAYGSVEDDDAVTEDPKELKSSNDMDLVETSQHQSKKHLRLSKEKAKNGVSGSDKLNCPNNGKDDALGSSSADAKNSKLSVRSSTINGDLLVNDPPSELKRLVDRIVEIILKNGQGFEALLIEQDKNHGRFPFLISSNQYHPYYKKMLRMAQESRAVAKSFDTDMKACQSKQAEESVVQDRKEKFKMVINKIKKEIQEQQPAKEPQQPPIEISVNAAAAILQAATRGIKNPNLDIFSKNNHLNSSNQQSSQAHSCLQNNTGNEQPNSSEAGLTREQKLKAERLKRAKMFAAKIKNEVMKQPLGKEAPADVETSHKIKKSEIFYRSKDLEEEEEEERYESRKKHRSHHTSHHHSRRHSSSKDRDKHYHHRHESSLEDEYERYKHKRRSSQKDAHGDDDRRKKQKKRSNSEEGEISAKSSDQSLSSIVDAKRDELLDRLNTEKQERASSEQPSTTVVSDDLRAKIRAMLLATL